MSDQRVSLRRSSNGKSNSVANKMLVSSIDTCSTQSNVSPTGNDSNTSIVRCRTCGSRLRRLAGADTLRTVLRWSVCVGGSMAMNARMMLGGVWMATGGPSVMPLADENVWWLPSTARTSSYFVIDQ